VTVYPEYVYKAVCITWGCWRLSCLLRHNWNELISRR